MVKGQEAEKAEREQLGAGSGSPGKLGKGNHYF